MNLGERIRKLRKRLGLTQKEFAGRVVGKVDYTYIGRMERGEQYPSIKMLEKIGKAFGVSNCDNGDRPFSVQWRIGTRLWL